MSSYICEKCGCIDNSASEGSNYWNVKCKINSFDDDYFNKHLACSECVPPKYADGGNSHGGVWHNKFPKRYWTKIGSKESIIAMAKKGQGNYVNAIEYFKTLE